MLWDCFESNFGIHPPFSTSEECFDQLPSQQRLHQGKFLKTSIAKAWGEQKLPQKRHDRVSLAGIWE